MLRTIVIVFLLANPAASLATECSSTTQTCAEGHVWDEETRACIQPST